MKEIGEDQPIGEDSSDDYEARENLWDQAWPGDSEREVVHATREIGDEDELSGFPESVGTRDPLEAARDAEPYVPPIDPPVLPGGAEAIHTATGFGTDVEEETERGAPYERDGDVEDEVTLLLRQDSLASHWEIVPNVEDGVVTLRGTVPTVDDAEYIQSIVGEVRGVVDVEDEMTIDPDVPG
jgi:osmotically-inducible protein OsmY